MSVVDLARASRDRTFVDEDGHPAAPRWHVGLPEDELVALNDAVAAEYGHGLSGELRAVLAETTGLDAAVECDFTGRSMSFGLNELAPTGLPIATDGCGNFWLYDLERGDIWLAMHDPMVFLRQSIALMEFVTEVLNIWTPPHHSLITRVHEHDALKVWADDPVIIARDAALQGDLTLREFAASHDSDYAYADLRPETPGTGFVWARDNADVQFERHPNEPIFAVRSHPRRRRLPFRRRP